MSKQAPPFRPNYWAPFKTVSVLTGRVSWRRGFFGRRITTVQERFTATQGYVPGGVYSISRASGDVWEIWRDATPQDLEEMGHQLMGARRANQTKASDPAA